MLSNVDALKQQLSTWLKAEDAILKAAVMKYGINNWMRIASLFSHKTAEQCKSRWFDYLLPKMTQVPWSPGEVQKLKQLHATFGECWMTISAILHRPPHDCRIKFYETNSKLTEKEKSDFSEVYKKLNPHLDTQDDTVRPLTAEESEMIIGAKARINNRSGKKLTRKMLREQIEARREQLNRYRCATLGHDASKSSVFNAARMRYRDGVLFNVAPTEGKHSTSGEQSIKNIIRRRLQENAEKRNRQIENVIENVNLLSSALKTVKNTEDSSDLTFQPNKISLDPVKASASGAEKDLHDELDDLLGSYQERDVAETREIQAASTELPKETIIDLDFLLDHAYYNGTVLDVQIDTSDLSDEGSGPEKFAKMATDVLFDLALPRPTLNVPKSVVKENFQRAVRYEASITGYHGRVFTLVYDQLIDQLYEDEEILSGVDLSALHTSSIDTGDMTMLKRTKDIFRLAKDEISPSNQSYLIAAQKLINENINTSALKALIYTSLPCSLENCEKKKVFISSKTQFMQLNAATAPEFVAEYATVNEKLANEISLLRSKLNAKTQKITASLNRYDQAFVDLIQSNAYQF